MEVRKGYKQTEVGIVPEDWFSDQIKNIAQITTGSKNTQDRIDSGEYPFIVRSQTVERINSYSFDGEAVLTAGDGVGTGKIFHYINGKFDFHQRVYKISNFAEKINGYYFFQYFSNNFYNRIMQMTAKSSVDSVRMEMIADMPIPLPPTKAEQTAIATALSDADALIQSLEKLITKKRLIKQGAMQELLKPKEGWLVRKLGELTNILKGNGLSKSKLGVSGKNKCILYGELFTTYCEVINYVVSKTHSLEGRASIIGDILLPGSTTTKGIDLAKASALMQNDVLLGGDIIVLRKKDDSYNPSFLSHLLTHIKKHEIAQLTKGITIHHLHGKDLNDIDISLPALEDQNRTAAILSDIDAEISGLEKKLAKYKHIKQGMMQELLTGKTRLI